MLILNALAKTTTFARIAVRIFLSCPVVNIITFTQFSFNKVTERQRKYTCKLFRNNSERGLMEFSGMWLSFPYTHRPSRGVAPVVRSYHRSRTWLFVFLKEGTSLLWLRWDWKGVMPGYERNWIKKTKCSERLIWFVFVIYAIYHAWTKFAVSGKIS